MSKNCDEQQNQDCHFLMNSESDRNSVATFPNLMADPNLFSVLNNVHNNWSLLPMVPPLLPPVLPIIQDPATIPLQPVVNLEEALMSSLVLRSHLMALQMLNWEYHNSNASQHRFANMKLKVFGA